MKALFFWAVLAFGALGLTPAFALPVVTEAGQLASCPSGYGIITDSLGTLPAPKEGESFSFDPVQFPSGTAIQNFCVYLTEPVSFIKFNFSDISTPGCSSILARVTPPSGSGLLQRTTGTIGKSAGEVSYGSISDSYKRIPAGFYKIEFETCAGCAAKSTDDVIKVGWGWENNPGTPVAPPGPGGLPLPPGGPLPPIAVPSPVGTTQGLMEGAPGCDKDMWNRIITYTDAMTLRDVAYTEELLGRSDSTMELSCFDRAIMESAKAGDIFSDIANLYFPAGPQNGLGIFTMGKGELPGVGEFDLDNMGKTLGYLVAPNLAGFLENFINSLGAKLSDIIGGTLGGLFDLLGGIGGQLFDTLFGGLFDGLFGSTEFECDSMKNLWEEIITDGNNPQTPFFTMDDFLNATFTTKAKKSGKKTYVGETFLGNLNNNTGPAVRENAEDALMSLYPGNEPYFTPVPTMGEDGRELSVDDVLGKM